MSVSCLIVTKNRVSSLQRLIRSIENQTLLPEQVVIVNDAGESFQLESTLSIKVIRLNQSVQSGRARNEGMKHIQSKWCLILDDDVELKSSDFIESAFSSPISDETGILFPRKIDCYAHTQFELSFFQESFTGELKKIELDQAKEISTRNDILFGPMVYFIRKQAFESALGYDPIYGLGKGHTFREESDFQRAVQLCGWRTKIIDTIFFNHWIQKAGGHGPNDHKRCFWIAHNQVVFAARSNWSWPVNTLLFTLLELPRYCWGNGRLLTYPAGLMGILYGFSTALIDFFHQKDKKRHVL